MDGAGSWMIVRPQPDCSTFMRPFLLLTALLSACAGPSLPEEALASRGILPENRPVRVTLLDHRAGTKVGLFNESMVSKTERYSVLRREATYKVIPDLDMGVLLKQLEQFDFFEDAIPSANRVRGARITLQVSRADQVWTLAFVQGDPAEKLRTLQDCRLAVLVLYDRTLGLQVIENKQGADIFKSGTQPKKGG